jgi:hypothetical protein
MVRLCGRFEYGSERKRLAVGPDGLGGFDAEGKLGLDL